VLLIAYDAKAVNVLMFGINKVQGVVMSSISSHQTLRILVTGATGFIGQPLCECLREAGYQVWVLSRDPVRAQKILGVDVCVIQHLSQVHGQSFDAVINLAGEPLAKRRWSPTVKDAIKKSRIGLTEELFAFFKQEGHFPKVLISGSAIGIYGNSGDKLLAEGVAVGDDFAAHLCRDWEAAAYLFENYQMRVCTLRTGIVLDANGGALKQMLPAFRMGLGGRLGDGSHYMSWIHRKDLIRLILFCLSHSEISGAVNAVAPSPVTNQEFTLTLSSVLRRPAIFPMPRFVLRLLFGEIADALLLSSQRVLPERILASGFTFDYPSLNDALAVILKK